jgi:hypothetical protein
LDELPISIVVEERFDGFVDSLHWFHELNDAALVIKCENHTGAEATALGSILGWDSNEDPSFEFQHGNPSQRRFVLGWLMSLLPSCCSNHRIT